MQSYIDTIISLSGHSDRVDFRRPQRCIAAARHRWASSGTCVKLAVSGGEHVCARKPDSGPEANSVERFLLDTGVMRYEPNMVSIRRGWERGTPAVRMRDIASTAANRMRSQLDPTRMIRRKYVPRSLHKDYVRNEWFCHRDRNSSPEPPVCSRVESTVVANWNVVVMATTWVSARERWRIEPWKQSARKRRPC